MNNIRRICQLKLITIKFFIVTMLFSTSALSANYIKLVDPNSTDDTKTSYAAGAEGQNDIVVQALKNSQGISFNRFNYFKISEKALSIYNGTILTDGSPSSDSSRTIVIEADSIDLSQEIKIIGAPADLLIISPNNISCSQCRFVNVGRVTIANASYSNTSTVGLLTTSTSGTITINDLTAPGIQSVEFIAENINLAGTINTNFRADIHPESGMIVSENGVKTVGGGGVNLYPGKFTIDYETLEISSASATNTHTISADILSASIAITSPNAITVPSGSDLNTANDALSSSVRNGQFYAPLEGIFLSTLKNENANITIQGRLITDNNISLKSYGDITLSGSSSALAKNIELMAKNTIITAGLVQTTSMLASSTSYINTGNIGANIVTVDVDENIFNSYGGNIKAKTITLKALNGYVINGSRSKFSNYSPIELDNLSVSLTALAWGIKDKVNTSGAVETNLSAHLLANEINIESKRFENINPYFLPHPGGSEWDGGIKVSSQAANQVSIQAENTLKIQAHQYALNSSAILGLNQQGDFHISTPAFHNARYYLKVSTFKYSQLVYNPESSRQEDTNFEEGTTSEFIEYSPPGRLYSFGEFRFSTLSTNSVNSLFSNEFSYSEFFQDSYFFQSNIKSLGLEVSNSFSSNQIREVRRCLTYKNCEQDQLTTTAEAETLLSFNGNLYGIDPSLPAQSELFVENINAYDNEVNLAITEYQAQFFYDNRTLQVNSDGEEKLEGTYGYIFDSSINDDVLTTRIKICDTHNIIRNRFIHFDGCITETILKNISELIDGVVAENEFYNTGYTYSQITTAAQLYINTLPLTNIHLNRIVPPKHLLADPVLTNTFLDVFPLTNGIGIIYDEKVDVAIWAEPPFASARTADIYTITISVSLDTLTQYIP